MGEVTQITEVELVLDVKAEVGEGPTWDADKGALIWVDITRNLVHLYDPESGQDRTIDVGQHVGAAVPRASGGLALALFGGFGGFAWDGGEVEAIAPVEADVPANRMNDGKCDAVGRFWAGTMDYDLTPNAAALYRLDPDHSVTKVLDEVTLSNGLGWSPDGSTMYYIDSTTYAVDAFDFDVESGTITSRRRIVEIAEEAGMPDGMTVDAEGFIWVALWGGWAVRRYSPAGELDAVVNLRVGQITSCAFGGPDLHDLYITSAVFGLSEDHLRDQPHAGGLFRCRPGIKGLPVHSYKG